MLNKEALDKSKLHLTMLAAIAKIERDVRITETMPSLSAGFMPTTVQAIDGAVLPAQSLRSLKQHRDSKPL